MKEEMAKNDLLTQSMAFVSDVRTIIEQGRKTAYAAAGQAAIATFWHVGRRIVEEEQEGKARAEYGKSLMKNLADNLVPSYGNCLTPEKVDCPKCPKCPTPSQRGTVGHPKKTTEKNGPSTTS